MWENSWIEFFSCKKNQKNYSRFYNGKEPQKTLRNLKTAHIKPMCAIWQYCKHLTHFLTQTYDLFIHGNVFKIHFLWLQVNLLFYIIPKPKIVFGFTNLYVRGTLATSRKYIFTMEENSSFHQTKTTL